VNEESKEKLERCVKRISASEGLPAFAHDIHELMTITADEVASVRRLTNTVLKNISLTSKLLRLVNSVYFNRSNTTILSVSHAVIIVGWEAIINLASSILLLEHFHKKSPGLKELMLLSLLTAHHAREIAIQARFPRPEEAYLCGMFSFLGELLVSRYLPEDYEQILIAIRNAEPAAEASHRILGFTYGELGTAVVRQWGLPDKVAAGMGVFTKLPSGQSREEALLHSIVHFSRQLTETVYRDETGIMPEGVKALIKKFAQSLPIKEATVKEVLNSAVQVTKEGFAAANIPFDDLRLAKSIENALNQPKTDEAPTVVEPQGDVGPMAFSSLTNEVELVLMSGEVFDLQDIIIMILEAIYRGGHFDRVLYCVTDDHQSYVNARTGLGEGVDALITKFSFPISLLSGPIGPSMIAQRDVFVDLVSESRYKGSDFVEVVGAASFGICSLVIKGRAVGCLYFDRISRRLGLDDQNKKHLLTLRTHLRNLLAAN
jgi:HD-like signal output (HDOD) protein